MLILADQRGLESTTLLRVLLLSRGVSVLPNAGGVKTKVIWKCSVGVFPRFSFCPFNNRSRDSSARSFKNTKQLFKKNYSNTGE